MIRNFITTTYKVIPFLWILILSLENNAAAQSPEIPASVSFGGITVKFDRSAQNLIEEDVKNLMSNKKFWEEKMERAILYFPIVEGILMDEEVPIDFKYLAVQESSFKADVVSTSNAVGFWQFKPETARELNLRVDKDVDERKNISSSTHAAAWYLKKNNQQFNNWVSSLYSYYQGAGAVKKLVPENWSYAREVTLTGKTDRYMLRFFAHKIALEAGIERFRSNNKIILLESEYGKGQSFDEIARDLKINSKELESYNRWVTDGRVPTDREYLITIPVALDQVAAVREKLSLPVQSITTSVAYAETGFPVLKKSDVQSDKNGHTFYEINGLPGIDALPGDKPKTLAKAGKLRTPKFMRNNDLVRDMPLIPGNVYYLAKKNKKAAVPFHTARPGDTWQSVSQAYGIRLVNLLKFNRTISRNYPIQTGQVLWLAKKRPKKQPIEIIAPKQTTPAPVTPTPEIASAPATTAPAPGSIPEKLSGRKKYTPVLVEKSESSIAKENQSFEPGVTPPSTQPVAVATPSVPNKETNDRVIIITQDNAEGSFKSAEEKAPVVKNNAPASNVPKTTTPPGSVYSRQQREANEKAAAEKSARDREETLKREAELKREILAKREAQAKKESELTKEVTPERNDGFHVVKAGETYFSISRKYGMKVSELFDLNNRQSRSSLSTGEKLRVKSSPGETVDVVRAPGSTSIEREAESIAKVRETRRSGGAEFHTVEVGQTYYSISRLHNLSINELLNLNNLTGTDRLRSGQKLRVRKSGEATADDTETTSNVRSSGRQTHTVASGETLFRISQNYGTSVDEIKKLNNMSDNNVVVGQKLKIPQK